MKKKLKLKWKIIFIIIFLILITFVSARFVGTKGLIITEEKIIDNIPKSFYGLKIVHFSDLHYGMSVNEDVLSNLVNNINKTKPDIVVFTGDLIDRDTTYTEEIKNIIIKYLSKIKSIYGNYYVNGNHDLVNNSFDLLMTSSNFKSLNNTSDIIYSSELDTIYIGGMSVKNYDITYLKELEDYDYKIFIMHYPDYMDKISQYNFDLVLSGHSHNGQVRLPFIGALVKPDNAKKYYEEYYKINNTNLYISGGIGNSKVNLRLFNMPSFNLYRIVDK